MAAPAPPPDAGPPPVEIGWLLVGPMRRRHAEAARRALEDRITRTIERFGPAEPWLDEEALYRRNLISGFVESTEALP